MSLDELKTQIEATAAKIVTLKGSGGTPEEIKDCVKSLLKMKSDYAGLNNGIGVDGKPFVAEMTSAEKKKKAKEEKQAAAAAAAAAASAPASKDGKVVVEKAEDEMTPENKAKKEAKKAAKKAGKGK